MKAVGYIRVSTDKEEQAQSLVNQKNLIINYIKEKGYSLVDFYVDVESGTTHNREALKKLIDDVEKNKFNLVISKELSRLARNGELSHKLKNVFENHNIHLITLDGAINTVESRQDLFGLYAWLYEQESQRISSRIKDVFKTKQKNGEFLGSIPPYGYKIEDKKLYLRNDETVEVVKLIFNKFIGGWGYDKIARHLSKLGYETPAQAVGKKNAGLYWQGSTIRKILTNQHYTGDLVQHRETTISVVNKKRKQVKEENMIIVENTHEAIISKKDFKKVQEIIESKKAKGRGKSKEQKHLFTNFLYCSDCGTGLWYRQNRLGYICGRYAKHGTIACSHHFVSESELKNIILEDIKKVSKKIDTSKILNNFKSKIEKIELSKKDKITKINKEIEILKKRQSKLLDNLLDEIITKEVYQLKDEEIKNTINNLEIEKLNLENENTTDYIKKLNVLKEELEKILNFNELTHQALNQLVEKIEVKKDGTPKIYYKFKEPVGF